MLTVTVRINGNMVDSLSVQRMVPLRKLSNTAKEDLGILCTYKVRNQYDLVVGTFSKHRYGDGASQLAAKVLRKFGRNKMR